MLRVLLDISPLVYNSPLLRAFQLVTTKKRSGFTDKRPGFADKHSDFTERQSGFAHKQTGFARRRKPTFEKRPLGSYFARYPSLLGFLEKYLATRKTRNVIVTLETPDKERSQGGQRNNVVLELILFTITAGAFAMFNIIYWSGRMS